MLGRSAAAFLAASAGRARLPKKKWRREEHGSKYKYKQRRPAIARMSWALPYADYSWVWADERSERADDSPDLLRAAAGGGAGPGELPSCIGDVPVTNEWLALAIFLAAAGTDLLDGYLARRWRQVTTIGTLLDPIADKLLISAALISLVQVRVLPGWMAILIIGREFAVSGLRSIAAAEGYTIKASDLGKTKMFRQVVAISCMLLAVRHPALLPTGHGADVDRGLLRLAFGDQLLPQVLAQGG